MRVLRDVLLICWDWCLMQGGLWPVRLRQNAIVAVCRGYVCIAVPVAPDSPHAAAVAPCDLWPRLPCILWRTL